MYQQNHGSPFVNQDQPQDWPPGSSGSLANLRLAVKDLFDIAGIPTSAGNPDWLRSHKTPKTTASAVRQLAHNGAVYVGKTLTDEMAYSLNGTNVHYPALHNCLDTQRLCGGSSSGSAVAVGLGLADIGLGTDTGGSIRVPASYNGLYGFRPTHGVISTDGVIPLAPSFDTVGWITRDFAVLEKVAKVLLPPKDPGAPLQPLVLDSVVQQCDYRHECELWIEQRCPGPRIEHSELSFEMLTIASHAFRVLQGREIIQTHEQWIHQVKPQFAEEIQQRIEWCATLTREDELQALDQQDHFIRLINELLANHQVLLLPTTPGAAPLIKSDKNWLADYRNKLMAFTCIAGLAGLPQLHLPVFTKNNNAYGISVIGSRHSDLQLLAYAKKQMEN